MASNGPNGTTSPKTITDLSEEFSDAYMKGGLGEIDPFLLFCCQSLSAKTMTTTSLSTYPGASQYHKLFLDQVMASNVAGGLGIPVRTSAEDMFGGWIFTNLTNDRFVKRLHKDHGDKVHLTAVLAYERMSAIGMGSMFKFNLLSGRERECLLWLCVGLRVSGIAEKLSLSESAVKLYITNAKLKLGARTREQAIARAICSGEITL